MSQLFFQDPLYEMSVNMICCLNEVSFKSYSE